MAVAALKFITEVEYLAIEDASADKHEYYNGQIYDMAGSMPDHAHITANAIRHLGNLADGSDCVVYTSDLRIRVSETGLYTYPDASVICGMLHGTDNNPPAALNPTLIVEVLSTSTMHYDRGEKWRHYQTIESLKDYLLVWHDRPRIEHYARLNGGHWEYSLLAGLGDQLTLLSLPRQISLGEIYRGITFPPVPPLRVSPLAEGSAEVQNDNS